MTEDNNQQQKPNQELLTSDPISAVGSIIGPIIGGTLRPLAMVGIKSLLFLANTTKTTVQLAREEIEDIVAEAQFERMKNQLDKEISTAEGGGVNQTDRSSQ
ncbi:MAG: DUF5132 domain-containing protein [Desulfitobacterium hafniense]|nr:DUF5132 domain-containing protein [Desulfitobacterium hafniense]